MTGFSTAEARVGPFRLVWEIRSVNHRFLELGFRLPEDLRAVEPDCRELVGASIKRGKVDCSLKIGADDRGRVADTLVAGALERLRALEGKVRAVFPDARAMTAEEVLRWPGVLEEPAQNLEELGEAVKDCLGAALRALTDSRAREGARIAEMLEKRNAAITALLSGIRPQLDGVQLRYRERLRERLERLDVKADPERLEQELALVAQRADVAEEIDRIASHVAEVEAILKRNEPVGRRLDFVIQELNREANTFASKVQDEALTRVAVELKVLIEQMREQVQNLE
ncbi:MAG TPA: YicC/YloC family endoribonuclease [Gammaproteobacteria bacterium]|nr:YicC/YloC family endoribonuclease [Gammaproteobacteria bacterium]